MPSLGSTRGGPRKQQNPESDLYVTDTKPISTEDIAAMSKITENVQKYLESDSFKHTFLADFQEWLFDRHERGAF